MTEPGGEEIVFQANQHGIGASQQGGSSSEVKPQVKVQIFTGKGWHLWKFKMRSYFQWMGVWDVVSGEREEPGPQSTQVFRAKYNKDELTARNILLNILDDERLQLITQCDHVPQMWKVLEEKFEVITAANKLRLELEFTNQRQGNKTIDEYLRSINESIDKLRGIGKEIADQDKLFTFLKGLNKEFKIITVMLENTDNMTFEKATHLARTHEMRYLQDDEEEAEAYSTRAYYGRGRGRARGGRSGGQRGRGRSTPGRGRGGNGAELICYNCNTAGHYSRNCPDSIRHGKTCHNCGKKGHMSYNCPSGGKGKETSESFVVEGIIGEANTVSKSTRWIVDSGSTHHICNEEGAFSDFGSKVGTSAVLVGDNSRLEVQKEGKVGMTFKVGKEKVSGTVEGVLLVPNMGKNLFSVTKTMQQGKSVIFDCTDMTCKIMKGNKQVGRAKLQEGLWILDCDTTTEGKVMVSQKGESLELWHQRMGHLGEDNLLKLQKKQMVNGLETPLEGKVKGCCQGCNQGKQHREPFPETEHIVREKLELIVSDIKGPINPKSHGGFC